VSDAHEAIRNLLGRYCELMDAADWIGLGHLFAQARLVDEHGAVVAEGSDPVMRLYEHGTHLYDGSPRTRHITANTVIDLEPSGETATARSSFVVFQGTDELALQPIITGRYRDRFVCGGDRNWRFEERCFIVDQLGDISRHLTYELPR
jgi:3-phenylpropionate/cinnamic acid dioxygenase small subunit